jgi:hypothetical protein
MPRVFMKGADQPPFYPENGNAHARYEQPPGVAGEPAFRAVDASGTPVPRRVGFERSAPSGVCPFFDGGAYGHETET